MHAQNLEVLVESHRIASERVRAGLPRWKRTVDMRSILSRDSDDESIGHLVGVANEVGRLLATSFSEILADTAHPDHDRGFAETVEALTDLAVVDFDGAPPNAASEEIDARLSEVYDWADLHRVWLGP